jgi:hypothetical protein
MSYSAYHASAGNVYPDFVLLLNGQCACRFRQKKKKKRATLFPSLSLSLNGLEFNIRQTPTQVLHVMQDETNA